MAYSNSGATWRGQSIRGVLFDLDGTLLDTAADITRALNRTVGERGWAPLPVSEVSRMIGRGSPILIERAAASGGHTLSSADHEVMVERFFHHYGELEETNESDATAYVHVADTLQRLHEAGLKTAVVTNKQHRFATALLQRLDLNRWIDVVVGGDSCERRKPDPQPLLHACQLLALAPSEAIMVGDSINDVLAAHAVPMPVLCVPYGYNEGRDPRTLECDLLIDNLGDLPGLLWNQSGPTGSSRSSKI